MEETIAAFRALDARVKAIEQRLENTRDSSHKVLEKKEERKRHMGPMFVKAIINGLSTKAAIVSGATHNVLSVKEAVRLGLTISPCDGCIRGPFTDWEPITGAAWKVSLRVGSWEDYVDFMVFRMDAVDVILGRDFLFCANVNIRGAINGIFLMGGEKPEFVEAEPEEPVDMPRILTLEICLREDEQSSAKP